jgi:NTE family protein
VTAQDLPGGPRRTRVAVALGGGGARGYAHIGVLQVLEERGYEIAGIAGSSMGALVGGLYAADGLDAFSAWVRGLTHRDVLRLYDPSPRAPGAIRAGRIFARVSDIVGDARIEGLRLPFTAVATDLEAGEERWFQEGRLDAAIRASVALPGFMTPVVIQGRLLADGGLLNPLPIAPLVRVGADVTVAVAVSGRHRAPADATAAAAHRTGGHRGDAVRRTGTHVLDREVLRGIGSRLAVLRGAPTGRAAGPIAAEARETVLEALPAGLRTLDVMELSLAAVRTAVLRQTLADHPPDVLITVPRSSCRTLDFHRADEMIRLGRLLAAQALDRAGDDPTRDDVPAVIPAG